MFSLAGSHRGGTTKLKILQLLTEIIDATHGTQGAKGIRFGLLNHLPGFRKEPELEPELETGSPQHIAWVLEPIPLRSGPCSTLEFPRLIALG